MQVTVIEEVALTAGCSRFDARFVLAPEALSTTPTAAGHSEPSSHRHWITWWSPDHAAGSSAGIFAVLPPGGVRGGAPTGRPMGAGFLPGGQGPAERRSDLPLVPAALPARQGVALRSACHPPIDPQILPKSRNWKRPTRNISNNPGKKLRQSVLAFPVGCRRQHS